MTYTVKQYGWIRDVPDHRDHLYAAPVEQLASLPRHVDLRPHCPNVYDQGQLGSCTANGIAAAIQFDRMKQKLVPRSRLPGCSSITTSVSSSTPWSRTAVQ